MRLKIASYGFVVLIPLIALWLIGMDVLYWGYGIERLNSDILGQNFYEIYPNSPIAERQLYGGLAAIPVLMLRLISFWYLWKMFLNFTHGKILVKDTVYHLKQYAKYAVFGVLAAIVFSGVKRWGIGEFSGDPLWTHLELNSHDSSVLFTSAIIFIASKIIAEGNRFKTETESYV